MAYFIHKLTESNVWRNKHEKAHKSDVFAVPGPVHAPFRTALGSNRCRC